MEWENYTVQVMVEAIEEMGKDYFENKSYEDYVDLEAKKLFDTVAI
ncbi:MAG: hypothetical protein ACLSBH_20890 [Coprobacillus cateniformis]